MVDVETLETIGEGALDVGLSLVGMAFPAAIPFIALAKEAVPALIAARPYVIKAVQDGASAFRAAEAASPGLGAQIETMARQIPMAAGVVDWAAHLDFVTANASNHELYLQNLRDSGYDPKNDFDENGNMKAGG